MQSPPSSSSPSLQFWEAVRESLLQGANVFLALVADHSRHSPGTKGARLMISAKGDLLGTIGGGIMEHRLCQRARAIVRSNSFRPQLQTLIHRKAGPGEKSGMICAGEQTNLYLLCRPESDSEPVQRLVAGLQGDCRATLEVDSAGLRVVEEAPDLDQPRISLRRTARDWRYREQILNRKRIAIVGGGHCSLALSAVMSRLGYDVTVFETRPGVGTFTGNPFAGRLHEVADFSGAGPAIDFPTLTPVVVMTVDVPSDVRGLSGLVGRPFPWIGVMGSKTKIAAIAVLLGQAGIDLRSLPNLRAPVGLPMSSRTPEEIAISVASQILRERPVPNP